MATGKLFLIPTSVEDELFPAYLPAEIATAVRELDYFVVEELKTARRFIKKIYRDKNIDACTFAELNEHTAPAEIKKLLEPLLQGHHTGLMSEAGCPGIADPGQQLVALAHRHNIQVIPLVGPSSIFLALMASGLNGQQFKFNGYLPKEQNARRQKLRELEKDSLKTGTTHIFIETPYRNDHLMADMLQTLNGDTLVCVACEIKSAAEFILTKPAKDWAGALPVLHKKNTVFLIGRDN